MNRFHIAIAGLGLIASTSNAAIVITEVNAGGSGASYGVDWFELTNTGVSDVDITGWKMDDSSAAFGTAVAIRGITSIPAGKSVILFEGNTSGSTDATNTANLEAAWFGSNIPSGFLIGAYGGSGVGLSTTAGDGVAIFNSGGTLITSVTFGVATGGATFDNTAGLTGAISQISSVGVNGAFTSFEGAEVGSPGVTIVPEPASLGLLAIGGLIAIRRRRA